MKVLFADGHGRVVSNSAAGAMLNVKLGRRTAGQFSALYAETSQEAL